MDGVIFSMRVVKSIEKVPVPVAIGVTDNGSKLVLGIQSETKSPRAVGGSSSETSKNVV